MIMPGYNSRFTPPAPVIDVVIQNPFLAGYSASEPAVLDTAADITAIPESVARALCLEAAPTIAVSGLDDVSIQHVAYIVNLQVVELTFERMLVIEWGGAEILLGRDVLNEFIVTLDGKMRQFEIRDP